MKQRGHIQIFFGEDDLMRMEVGVDGFVAFENAEWEPSSRTGKS